MSAITTIKANLLALTLLTTTVGLPIPSGSGKETTLPARPWLKETTVSDSVAADPETGLVIDDGLMLVKSQCTACHSSKLILQSHFPREKWVERIRWMQRTQNLWDLGESEPAILAYLTKHYGPVEDTFDGRREPLNKVPWQKQSN